MKTQWPQAYIDDLKRSWPEESADTIGSRIGKSRNAVIGMAHRLHLEKKRPGMKPSDKVVTRKPTLRRRELAAVLQTFKVIPSKPIPLAEEPVPFLEARWHHCRAIVEDHGVDGLAVFCGKPIIDGQGFSFCAEHLNRFINKGYAR